MRKIPSDQWKHGTWNTYSNHRCRCELCAAAARVYQTAAHRRRMQEDPEEVRRQQAERQKRYRDAHPERAAEAAKRWREAHPEQAKATSDAVHERWRLRQYQIEAEQRDALLAAQDGKCAICGNADSRRLSIDHCHRSKKVRGLLCRKCNLMLGCAEDDIGRLQAAIDYLKRYEV